MKRAVFIMVIVGLVGLVSCAKKRGEEEYVGLVREAKSKGNLEEALKYERDLIKYYPKSEKIIEYKKNFIDDLLAAAEKDTSEKRALLYKEAIFVGDDVDRMKSAMARLRLGVWLEKKDSAKAKEMFGQISQKELETIASLELGEQRYANALKCYSILLERFPQDTSAYKWYFMTGFIMSEYMQRYDEAKEYFKIVFERYPQSELADDAHFLYENVGKNLEEIIFASEKEKPKTGEKKKK